MNITGHYDDPKVKVTARIGDYTHRPDGCYLTLEIGDDDYHMHVESVEVLGRIADTISAAVREYMHELDESVINLGTPETSIPLVAPYQQ